MATKTAKKVQRDGSAELIEAGNGRSTANLQSNSASEAADMLNVSERRMGQILQAITVLPTWMLGTSWVTTASAVQAADVPSVPRRTLTALARGLGRSAASEPLNRVYGVL